jgi:hypothetical protein
MSKWTRARRKQAGAAGVQYLRWGRFFVLLATHGQHAFFTAEVEQIRDLRRCPLRFEGYSIGCRRGRDGAWHASVRIERQRFAELKRELERLAVHRTVEELAGALRPFPTNPMPPCAIDCGFCSGASTGGARSPGWSWCRGMRRVGGVTRCSHLLRRRNPGQVLVKAKGFGHGQNRMGNCRGAARGYGLPPWSYWSGFLPSSCPF